MSKTEIARKVNMKIPFFLVVYTYIGKKQTIKPPSVTLSGFVVTQNPQNHSEPSELLNP